MEFYKNETDLLDFIKSKALCFVEYRIEKLYKNYTEKK